MYRKFISAFSLISIFLISVSGHADVVFDRTQQRTYVDAAVLTDRIKTGLAAEQFSNTTQINVQADNAGNVLLTGTATTAAIADQVVAVTRATEGVEAVKSELIIRRTN